jgi:hypothetical protein
MVVVLPAPAFPIAVDALAGHGIAATVVGEVVEAAALGHVRYVEDALESLA